VSCLLTTLFSALLIGQAPSVEFHPVLTGAMPKIGFFMPQRLTMSATRPESLKNVPEGAALFGTWEFGGKKFPAIEIDKGGQPFAVDIDFSGKGDFRQAKPTEWKARPQDSRKPDGFKLYMADLMAPSPIGGGKPVQVTFYRFDPNDAERAKVGLRDALLYYANYALDGKVTLGGKSYHAMVIDFQTHGEFLRGSGADKTPPSTAVLIDRNGDGRFNSNFEMFDAAKPFNIGGTTYEINGVYGGGKRLAIVKSRKVVAEIPIPAPLPTFHPGTKVISFTATDTSGKTVHFPDDFRGKVVMLDFWATWCGPCMGEVPNVVKVYNQMHDKGFEILGISLDNKDTIKQIVPVTQKEGMTWNQIADGKFWDADIAKLYGIRAIPAAFIVDGNTGKVVAEGEAIRGDALLPAVTSALNGLKGAP